MIKINFRPFQQVIDTIPLPVDEYEVIEEEAVFDSKPPIYLEDDLLKIKSVAFGGQIEDEMKFFKSPTYSSGPFIKYKLQNMLILKNRLYFDKYEHALDPREKTIRFYDSNSIEEFETAAYSSMRISTSFFGHWLREELQLIEYLQGKSKIVSSSPLTKQKAEIINLFGVDFSHSPFAKIKNVDMYHGWQHSQIHKDIFQQYKQKISALKPATQSQQLKVVYLGRGSSGSITNRKFENEKHVLEYLDQHYEFSYFEAESTPINQLYSAIYDADIILGVEGSQMAHGIIAGKPGATLLCIQPPYRFYNPFKNYCDDAKLNYAILVADQEDNANSFLVDVEKMKHLFDKVDSLNNYS